MNKAQALYTFWSSFGLPAYDELTIPDEATMPYITYSVSGDNIGSPVPISASVWYRSTTWENVSRKVEEISRRVNEHGHVVYPLDNGYVYLTRGTPFAQRMSDADTMVRRVYINMMAEYLTAY